MEEIEIVQIKSSGCGVYTYDSNEQDINVNDYCIIENPYDSDDVDIGQVTWKQKIQRQKSSKTILKILRKATEEDIKRFEENTNKEKEAHVTCRKKIKDRQLPMKLVKSHYSFDCSKITFYLR
jgi:cell fate regulator YaaT (PSP1 superfamily)